MSRKVVKKVENAVLFDDGCIRIDNVRASYPHLAKAWAKNEGDTPKFSLTGLGAKKSHDAVKALCVEVINKLLADNNMGKIGAEHKFIKNGDDSGKDEAEGMWVIKASENADKPPTCRDRRGDKLSTDEIEKIIYAGCYVNMLIRPWAQDNKHGKKINANLIAVQFFADGERFGEGSIDDEGAFEQYEESADGFDDDDSL
jgi:hypothetical protein